MKLTRVAGGCADDMTCPAVDLTDRDTVVVRGYELSPTDLTQLDLPDGESAVEIPLTLLREAARALG